MGAMKFAVMLLAGCGLALSATGCGHFHDDEDDDHSRKAYDQVGEVRVYDERPKAPAARSERAVPAHRVQVVTAKPAPRYDQVGEADLQD